jgi:hypothetical protein
MPLSADDMIGSLATRVRELSLRVAQLEGDLEAARRRIAVYEDFDLEVQDSLSAALRAANQIRERASAANVHPRARRDAHRARRAPPRDRRVPVDRAAGRGGTGGDVPDGGDALCGDRGAARRVQGARR